MDDQWYFDEQRKNEYAATDKLNVKVSEKISEYCKRGVVVFLTAADIEAYGICLKQENRELCNKALKDVLGYESFEFNEDYVGYELERKTSSYVSSYSGTVSSSGNVSLSPNYSSYSYMTYEAKDKKVCKHLIIKAVEKGKDEIVKNKEKKFFSDGGMTYLNLKMGVAELPGKMWKMQRLFAILNLIFLTIIFGVLNYVANTVVSVGDDINVIFAIPTMFMIIFYIIFGICLSRNRRDVKIYYNVESKTSKNFLILLIVFFILSVGLWLSAYSPEFEYSGSDITLLSIVLEVITILISIMFLIVSVRLSGKNPYAKLYKEILDLKKDSAKIAELENLASEIRSYTVS